MNVAELLERVVRPELDDTVEPYLWSNAELLDYAIDAQHEACRRGRLLVDSTTVAVCQLALTAGVSVYALDPRVIRVNRIRLTGDASPLTPMMVRDLDRQLPGWEDDTGDRMVWVPDWQTGVIKFVGNPQDTDTANMQVVRLPIADPADIDDTFEIRAEYHRNLRHWIMYRAWLKRDTETNNEKLAATALALFEREFGPARPAYDEQWMTQYYADNFNGRY